MASSKLDILIEAKNNASGPIRAVKNDIAGIDKAARNLSGGFGGLLAIGGVAGLGVLASQAASLGVELAGVATQMRRVDAAALELAGSQERLNALLATYDQVTGGVATRSQATAEVTRLMAVGFADSAEELERFLTAARGASVATGQGLDYIIGQLQLSIANQSTMRLDQLGLGVAEVNKRIDDLRASNAALSQEEAYQEAILGALIDKFGGLVTSTEAQATGVERLRRIWGDFTDELAANVGPAVDSAANLIANALEGVDRNNPLEETRAKLQLLISLTPQMTAEWVRLQSAMNQLNGFDSSAEGIRNLTAVMDMDLDAAIRLAQAQQQLDSVMDELGNTADASAAQLQRFSEIAVQAQRDAFAADVAMRQQAAGSIAGIAANQMGDLGAAGALNFAQQQTEELNRQINLWQEAGYSVDQIQGILIPGYLSGLRDANREVSTMAQKVPQISDAWRDMENAIGSVLSGALDPGVGVDAAGILESLGLRPDAINEDARRLADIAVNGFESPWLSYFQSAFPDLFNQAFDGADPKAAAAQLLLDFQDGLRPELLDKERAKELVKRALLGDANMKALSDEIAQELAGELGISLYEAQQAAAQTLGTTGAPELEAQGSNARSAFVIGFDGATVADTFINGLAARITARASDFNTSGKGAASAWGSGFLSEVGQNVPAALIDILFLRVMPQVQSALTVNDALQGAQ